MKLGVSKTLRKAAELVDAGWVQGTSAVDRDGRPINVYNDDRDRACKFCMGGAIEFVVGSKDSGKMYEELEKNTEIYVGPMIEFNDAPDTKKEEVVTLLLLLSEATK